MARFGSKKTDIPILEEGVGLSMGDRLVLSWS